MATAKDFKTTTASLTSEVGKLIQALNKRGNDVVAIHAIHQLTIPGVQCTKDEVAHIIPAAKATLTNLKLKSSGPNEKLKSGHLIQKTENGVVVAVFITQQPVDENILTPLSYKLVSKGATKGVAAKEAVPVND